MDIYSDNNIMCYNILNALRKSSSFKINNADSLEATKYHDEWIKNSYYVSNLSFDDYGMIKNGNYMILRSVWFKDIEQIGIAVNIMDKNNKLYATIGTSYYIQKGKRYIRKRGK